MAEAESNNDMAMIDPLLIRLLQLHRAHQFARTALKKAQILPAYLDDPGAQDLFGLVLDALDVPPDGPSDDADGFRREWNERAFSEMIDPFNEVQATLFLAETRYGAWRLGVAPEHAAPLGPAERDARALAGAGGLDAEDARGPRSPMTFDAILVRLLQRDQHPGGAYARLTNAGATLHAQLAEALAPQLIDVVLDALNVPPDTTVAVNADGAVARDSNGYCRDGWYERGQELDADSEDEPLALIEEIRNDVAGLRHRRPDRFDGLSMLATTSRGWEVVKKGIVLGASQLLKTDPEVFGRISHPNKKSPKDARKRQRAARKKQRR